MPADPRPRQVSVADWFDTDAALALAAAQSPLLLRCLASRPHQPMLWLGPGAGWPAPRPQIARLLALHGDGRRYAGDLCATLPLPLANASIGTLVLQHPPAPHAAALLADCQRLLLPGGVVLLVVGRRVCTSRVLHPGLPLWAAPAGGWRGLLADNGLQLRAVHRFDPGLPLSGACVVLEAEKRTLAPIGPRPIRRLAVQVASRQRLKVT